MHLEGEIELNSAMHLEAEIEGIWRCTWRPRSSEFGDALGGQDQVELRDALEAVIKRLWRWNWRP